MKCIIHIVQPDIEKADLATEKISLEQDIEFEKSEIAKKYKAGVAGAALARRLLKRYMARTTI